MPHCSRTQVPSLSRHQSLSLSPTSSSSLSYGLRSRTPSLPSSSPAEVVAAPGTGHRRRSLSCHCLAVSLAPSLRPSSPETEATGPGTSSSPSASSSSSATLAVIFLPAVDFLRTTWCVGFGVCKRDTAHGKDRTQHRRQFFCNKKGKRAKKYISNSNRKREHKALTRTDCEALLTVYFDTKTSTWRVKKLVEKHNHDLVP
ncbi:hypothetical protein AHAS_Ahas13G0244500 [Arachis hypogaea]